MGSEITVDLAKEVLRDAMDEEEKRVTIDLIQKKVAEHFDIRMSDMRAKKRTQAIAYPRQVAMYLVRDLTEHSLPVIGEYFGGRDHTTILHAYNIIKGQIKKDRKLKKMLDVLVDNIKK